eukprot:CAMPEP_0170497544 /NCGR_PEP_ID=MMETSP0208-20121228/25012_1 /TAXON_ID=197538 /ORGANISM="Strombidium inclinatum, Strain S3" /LENGTH=33 /DNA_ID= /DNA_START= /DNA_END= /DNA_ORIENTATION=
MIIYNQQMPAAPFCGSTGIEEKKQHIQGMLRKL